MMEPAPSKKKALLVNGILKVTEEEFKARLRDLMDEMENTGT